MPDASAVSAYRQALALRGESVTVTRLTGYAPAVTTVTANVQAVVMNYTPDSAAVARTGYGASEEGAITQTDRMVIIMAVDLAATDFPLPLQKHDQITLSSTGETLDVTAVDMSKRSFAGAIEVLAGGVA